MHTLCYVIGMCIHCMYILYVHLYGMLCYGIVYILYVHLYAHGVIYDCGVYCMLCHHVGFLTYYCGKVLYVMAVDVLVCFCRPVG